MGFPLKNKSTTNLERGDGIALLAHLLHLLARSVAGARVGDGMSMVTIGGHLHHERTLAVETKLAQVFGRLAHRQHVHAVHPDAGHVVAASVVFGRGRSSVAARAHAVAIVLGDEDHRQRPQLRHVVGLEHLTLVGGAIAAQGQGDLIGARILLAEGDARAERNLSADNAVATVETLKHGAQKKTRSLLAIVA